VQRPDMSKCRTTDLELFSMKQNALQTESIAAAKKLNRNSRKRNDKSDGGIEYATDSKEHDTLTKHDFHKDLVATFLEQQKQDRHQQSKQDVNDDKGNAKEFDIKLAELASNVSATMTMLEALQKESRVVHTHHHYADRVVPTQNDGAHEPLQAEDEKDDPGLVSDNDHDAGFGDGTTSADAPGYIDVEADDVQDLQSVQRPALGTSGEIDGEFGDGEFDDGESDDNEFDDEETDSDANAEFDDSTQEHDHETWGEHSRQQRPASDASEESAQFLNDGFSSASSVDGNETGLGFLDVHPDEDLYGGLADVFVDE